MEKSQEAFESLKTDLTTSPVLIFPDFTVPFVVETDACDVGIDTVLLQKGHPIAYFNKKLSNLRQKASTYSKEHWAITESIQKWRHYLLGGEFIIYADHQSLKNLLGQVIQSLEQQYFLIRLLGFSFSIEYKKGSENTVADALSRIPTTVREQESTQLIQLINSFETNWAAQLIQECQSNPWIRELIEKVKSSMANLDYSIKDGILYLRNLFYVGPSSDNRKEILDELHNLRLGGHSGYLHTLRRVK